MDNTTIGLIVSSCLLFISEILPYLPVQAKGIVQAAENVAVEAFNSYKTGKAINLPSP